MGTLGARDYEAEHLRRLRWLKPVAKSRVDLSRWGEVLVREVGAAIAPTYKDRVEGCLAWLSPGFARSLWDLYELEGGGCFLSPDGSGRIRLQRSGMSFDETVDVQMAGLCATMFAISVLQLEMSNMCLFEPRLARQASKLTRFMRRQLEAPSLTRVLD